MISKCFHKYSLGGDTTAPSGLYAGLCHAFLVFYSIVAFTSLFSPLGMPAAGYIFCQCFFLFFIFNGYLGANRSQELLNRSLSKCHDWYSYIRA